MSELIPAARRHVMPDDIAESGQYSPSDDCIYEYEQIDTLLKELLSGAEVLDELSSYIIRFPREFILALDKNRAAVDIIDVVLGYFGSGCTVDSWTKVSLIEARYAAIMAVDEVPAILKDVVLRKLGQIGTMARRSLIKYGQDNAVVAAYLEDLRGSRPDDYDEIMKPDEECR